MSFKEYLGDGVYADYDGYHVWLTTENGVEVTNRIALEPAVIESFADYIATLGVKMKFAEEKRKQQKEKDHA